MKWKINIFKKNPYKDSFTTTRWIKHISLNIIINFIISKNNDIIEINFNALNSEQ